MKRGHRQRGAGTVTVSRGEQTRQGVVCKEWQRTPMQLLHEFCQSKKRKNAIYTRVHAPGGKFRMRCVLPDDKNSAKDLAFCPEQDFETMDDAKHCAALLALKYVEPLRPLERKLPDPYRELWLAMETAGGKSSDKNNSSSAAAASSKTKVGKKKGQKAAASTIPDSTKTTDDDDGDGVNFWANADPEEELETKKPTSSFPTALTADRKFASHAEYQQAQREKVQERNKKIRSRENRERANIPKQVFMSTACREMIERVLKELGGGSVLATGRKNGTNDPQTGMNGSKEHAAAHEAFYQRVTKQLSVIGFRKEHIDGALQVCRKSQEHSDEEFMTMILDWLCLNIAEGELPKGFNPEGTQLDVVRANGYTFSNTSDKPTAMSSVLVQRLMRFGFDRLDAITVTNSYLQEHVADVGMESPSIDTTLALLQILWPLLLKHFSIDVAESSSGLEIPDEVEMANMRQDEIFALEAIYEDKLQIQTLEDEKSQVLVFDITNEVQLEVFLPSSTKYPFELPIIGLNSTNVSHRPYLLFTCGNVLKGCASTLGEPMIYDICAAVDTILREAVKQTNGKQIQLLRHPTKKSQISVPKKSLPQSENPPTASIPVFAKPEKIASNTKKNSGKPYRKHASRQQKVDLQAMKELSDKLLKLHHAKNSQVNFQAMLKLRATLPAAKEKATVLQYVVQNQVVLVCGQTGCGKTTQIPQFILDEYIENGRGGECQIICTQPRRIAAIGVATRVAQERCEDIADVVGYQIRMDAKKSANTRLLFCTTGVLLRRLLTDRSLAGVTHVIVDEVHERNIDTDFLLSVLRDLLPQRPDLRLILMSATMNADLFVQYFASISKSPCPVLDIPGFTYPVEVLFLEDVLSMTSYEVPKKLLLNKKKTTAAADGQTSDEKDKPLSEMLPHEIVERIDDSRIDYDMYVHLVVYLVCNQQRTRDEGGTILIFLPGTAEIKRLMEMLLGNSTLSSKVWVLPLHGSLSGADQSLIFKTTPSGKTKIIVSTNIAETSITINDVTAVIDCGKVKEMVYDNRQRRSQLLDCWAAQSACDQRKGRAGRVQAGTCYRMFSKKRFTAMDAQLTAEIHRVSLEQLCLQIKKLELGSIKGFLSRAIEPPKEEKIDAAIQELVEIAAFKSVKDDDYIEDRSPAISDEDVKLTPLGNHLAMLPLDARIGKFLIYGSILRCINPVVIIAACISSKSPFVMSMSDPELKEKQDAIKKELGGNWKSDHVLLWKLIDQYIPLKGQKMKRSFCRDYGLSYDTMETIVELKGQYLQQLDAIGFYDRANAEHLNLNSNTPRLIKAALCAGLYANVIQVVYPEQKYFQSAHGAFTEEHDAKKIRYMIYSHTKEARDPNRPMERVFLHPSSCNFVQTQYDSPWLLYTELVQTSKVFVRESTMVNPYALLLFGGRLDVIHEKNILCLDQWIRFHAVARIGVLIKAIRQHLDRLLTEKIANPDLDIAQSELVTAITHLLKTEGM